MKKSDSLTRALPWLMSILLGVLVTACGGGRDPILGGGGNVEIAPRVTGVTPLANATAVPINTRVFTAAFSKAMNPTSLASAFTLACPGVTPTGTVTYAPTGNVATLTLTSPAALPASTLCTATITTAAKDTAGLALASNFVWTFTTGVAPDTTPPTVSSVNPLTGATGVAPNTQVSATFSEPMDPLTIDGAAFTLACPVGTPQTGTVTYAVGSRVATLTPTASLPFSTVCTATVTTAAKDTAGLGLASNFVWTFTTGAAPDTTRPTVSSTIPVDSATNVASNTQVTATFSEPMDPLTINDSNFTLACPAGTPLMGTVTYAVSGRVATFAPAAALPGATVCAATVTTGAKDLAGNAMAANKVWTFTTVAAGDTTAPTVSATNPVDVATGVCTNKTINATFSEPMDPLTINTGTFTLATTVGAVPVTGVVAYDAVTRIATFNPAANLAATTGYTATVKGGTAGVKDLAGNPLALDKVTTFTTSASICVTAPPLGAAAPFGGFGGNATLTNDGLNTVINGDIGVNAAATTITGLRDSGGNVYTVTPNNDGMVNGLIYTANTLPGPGNAVIQARADALVAFNAISPAGMPGGIDVSSLAQCPSCGGAGQGPGQLAGRTLPPGVYLSTTGTYGIGITAPTAGNLTLDAQGDANAVWVFQTAAGTGTLTVGLTGPATPATPIQVLLINGAQAKNVFWYVPAGATIGTGATMVGTMLSDASITFSTTGGSPPTAVTTTLNGRAIALTAGVTMTNTVINVPAP